MAEASATEENLLNWLAENRIAVGLSNNESGAGVKINIVLSGVGDVSLEIDVVGPTKKRVMVDRSKRKERRMALFRFVESEN